MTEKPGIFPAYDLYGETTAPKRPDLFHCETIRVRSQLYDWEISPHVHWHLSQVLFVANGTVELILDGATLALTGPQLVYVPSGIVHGFRFSPDVGGYVVTIAQIFLDGLPRQDALRARFQRPSHLSPDRQLTRRLLGLGRELLRVEREQFRGDVHRLHDALAEAWLRLASQPAAMREAKGATLARKFETLVEAHYRQHRPLAFYADRLACTERTLARQVNDALGVTPLQFINQRLLFEARRLLRFTNATCAEVAMELGFEDPSYFSRFYLRLSGRRPREEKAGAIAMETA